MIEESAKMMEAPSPIEQAHDRLSIELAEAHSAVSSLEVRLTKSIEPGDAPQAPEMVGPDRPGNSEHVRMVANMCETAAELTRRIRVLTSRLEV